MYLGKIAENIYEKGHIYRSYLRNMNEETHKNKNFSKFVFQYFKFI